MYTTSIADTIQLLRCFSSTKDESSSGSEAKKKGPVKIKETARSSAAAKLRPRTNATTTTATPVMPGSSTMNAPGAPRPVIRNKGGREVKQTVTKSLHPAHHFMDGGMPCDPVCPPYRLAEYGEESLYTLILLRHGESEWNKQNRYTGWCDVNLTEAGRQEARTAGRLLNENGIEIDQAFTSVLKRASFSCNMALNAAEQHWVPITKTWRLNERHYGALQGRFFCGMFFCRCTFFVSDVVLLPRFSLWFKATTKTRLGKSWASTKSWSCKCDAPTTCDHPP